MDGVAGGRASPPQPCAAASPAPAARRPPAQGPPQRLSKDFLGRRWLRNTVEQEQLKCCKTKRSLGKLEAEKPNEAAEAEKPKEASLQKQNLISNETNLVMLLTQVVEKPIQCPSETLEAAKTKVGLQAEKPKKPHCKSKTQFETYVQSK